VAGGQEYVIERITEDGKHVEVKVDKVRLPSRRLLSCTMLIFCLR
jgi:hypothetical protein